MADNAAFRFKVNTANGEDDRVLISHEDGVSGNLVRCARDICGGMSNDNLDRFFFFNAQLRESNL